jgi:hypothetical protein
MMDEGIPGRVGVLLAFVACFVALEEAVENIRLPGRGVHGVRRRGVGWLLSVPSV